MMQEELQRHIQLQCESAKAMAFDLAKRADLPSAYSKEMRNASRLHFTVSTILYATLCIAKVEDLEEVLSEESDELPLSKYFDIENYKHTLESARQWRSLSAKKAANMMFRGEFMRVFMLNIENLRGQLRDAEAANQQDLESLKAFMSATSQNVSSFSSQGSTSHELQEALFEIERLKSHSMSMEKEKDDYKGALDATESMLESSTVTIKRLEERYAVMQREATSHHISGIEALRTTAEMARLQAALVTISSEMDSQERDSALREQKWALRCRDLEKELSATKETTQTTIEELQTEKSRLNTCLESALVKIEQLAAELAQIQSSPGPSTVKAVIHAKNTALEDKEEIVRRLGDENAQLLVQLGEQKSLLISCEEKMALMKASTEDASSLLQSRMNSVQDECLQLKEKHEAELNESQSLISELQRSLEVTQQTLRQKCGDKEMEILARSASLSSNELHLIVKVQARARVLFAKARAHMIRLSKQAQLEGVLIALKPSVQGESGWYMHPDQSIYHFTLLENGNWVQTSPSLTHEEWEQVVKSVESKKPAAQALRLTPLTMVPIIHPLTLKSVQNVFIHNGTRALYAVLPI